MSQNSRANHAANRRRKAKKAQQRRNDPLKGMYGPERIALLLIAEMWSRLGADAPGCVGPVLLHATGLFECLGDCDEVLDAHHPGGVHRCRTAEVDHSRIACPACWSLYPHEVVPECGGLLLRHKDDGQITCTADECPGVDAIHGQTVPCRVLVRCGRCMGE